MGLCNLVDSLRRWTDRNNERKHKREGVFQTKEKIQTDEPPMHVYCKVIKVVRAIQ